MQGVLPIYYRVGTWLGAWYQVCLWRVSDCIVAAGRRLGL